MDEHAIRSAGENEDQANLERRLLAMFVRTEHPLTLAEIEAQTGRSQAVLQAAIRHLRDTARDYVFVGSSRSGLQAISKERFRRTNVLQAPGIPQIPLPNSDFEQADAENP